MREELVRVRKWEELSERSGVGLCEIVNCGVARFVRNCEVRANASI